MNCISFICIRSSKRGKPARRLGGRQNKGDWRMPYTLMLRVPREKSRALLAEISIKIPFFRSNQTPIACKGGQIPFARCFVKKLCPNLRNDRLQRGREGSAVNAQKMPLTMLLPIVAPAPKIAAFPIFFPNFFPFSSNLLGRFPSAGVMALLD